MSQDKRPRVVIVGAGFAGLTAAKILARENLELTVLDRNNHHLFQPLLYQVATAALSPADIAMPVRSILRETPGTEVLMADVQAIDINTRTVTLDGGEIKPYDYLLVASGTTHSYFGHPEWEVFAPGLKSLEDATEIRRRVLVAFESAERTRNEVDREALLTFIIVGGGPTGIELAGAIQELACRSLVKDFDHINPRKTRVILIEAGPRVLPAFAPKSSANAQKALERLGVVIELNKRVTNITPEGVSIGDDFIPSRTVIWAAGVTSSPLGKMLGAPLDRAGRVVVNQDLSVPGHPEIYVCGDLASVTWKDDLLVPGQAPGAMQEGRHAAHNILRQIRGEPTKPFQYKDKGSLATIGRARAVADVGQLHIRGWLAWILWALVHIFYLIGFRNRLLVLIQWSWQYFTFQSGTRLITGQKPWASRLQNSTRAPG